MTEKEAEKSSNVRSKGYVALVNIRSLTRYFSVKNVEEIRMVYNDTLGGLKAAVYISYFINLL